VVLTQFIFQVGLFHQQMKIFYQKHHRHNQRTAVCVDLWSLTFFTPLAGPAKGRIVVFLP
jgi:hypothetical protein